MIQVSFEEKKKMNKIKVVNEKIDKNTSNASIIVNTQNPNALFNIPQIEITVLKSTQLEIDYKSTESTKLDIIIHVLPNVLFSMFEMRTGDKAKVRYKYILEENSIARITQVTDIAVLKEMNYIYLKGENAKIDYYLKAMVRNPSNFDYIVYHEASSTSSNLYLNGVNFSDGQTQFTTSGFVPSKKEDCILNHSSHIIELNHYPCSIKPNLFIDEYNVSANHSALIDEMKKEDIFYLQSRGITKKDAEKLLIKGFLLSGVEENYHKRIEKIIQKYWR